MAYLVDAVHWLMQVFFALTGNQAWAIICLTVLVRVTLTPLTLWGLRASRRSAALQAEVKQIQSRYKGADAQARLKELYARSGGALLGGCLPSVAQIPAFWAMYSALSTFPFALPAGFFWLENLGAPDPFYILPALVVGTQVWQSLVTLPREQRSLALVLPLVLGFFLVKATAAVSLYWLTSNLVSLVQHFLFSRRPAAA